jgi:hypothetical protein
MIYEEVTTGSRTRRTLTGAARILFELKLDGPLIIGLALVAVYGLIILYSASGQSLIVIYRTLGRLALGTAAMLLLAQVNPNFLRRTSPWLYNWRLPAVRRVWRGTHRQRRAALARSGNHPLPAVGNHEARGADDGRVVSA